MTPPNKPEWMQLADADSAPQVKKVTRALPALVLAAALSIVGVGALLAQSGAETPATSNEQGASVSMTSSPSEPSPSKSISAADPSAIANPNAPQQPGIAAMPTGGGDDDDEDEDDDDDEDEDDDDDEEGDDD